MKKIFTLLFLALLSVSLFAQKQVNGVVVDGNGDPVIGASIQAKGSTQGTISDYEGKFELSVPESVKTLVVSFVGMATQEVAAGKNVKVVMRENSEVIQEVVVTGYGTVAKGAYAGSAQAVKAEDIEKKNPTDITKALAGEVAGVQVVNTSGQPGTVGNIRIRGIGSLNASTAPLYVVDGIPLEAGSVSAIDPGDIASTTILKDATATSLYGSRGANGVVLITTKKGSSNGDEGKIEIDIKAGANMRLLPMYDVITSPEDYVLLSWISLYNEARFDQGMSSSRSITAANRNLYNNSAGLKTIYNLWNLNGDKLIIAKTDGQMDPHFNPEASRKPAYENMESWYNGLFSNGLKLEASAKISGGNEKLNYYASFGYLRDEGYYRNSNFERFNTRANINYQPKKWLKGGLNIQYAYATLNNPGQNDVGSTAVDDGFTFSQNCPPIYPIYVHDAETGEVLIDPRTGGPMYDDGTNGFAGIAQANGRPYGWGINPAATSAYDKNHVSRHQTAANAFLEFKLYEGLKLTLNAGGQFLSNRINNLENPYYGNAKPQGGRTATAQYNYFSFTTNQLIEYNKTFDEHSIRVMAGHEINYLTYNLTSAQRHNLVLPGVPELGNAIVMDAMNGWTRTSTLESALATATYEYDNRYLITGNYRADGSSRFAPGHRWGHFGSVGAAWNFTNEHFMEGTDAAEWLKNGKLRLSWGMLGNQDFGLESLTLYSDAYAVENVNDEPAYTWVYKGNPELTWERTSTLDLGLELSIGKWLDVELDYFYKNTDHMLCWRAVAPSLGYPDDGYYVNDAAMINQGFEFDLKAHLVDMRNIKLDAHLNGGFYRNKITEMPIDSYDEQGNPIRMDRNGSMILGHSVYDWSTLSHYVGVDEEGVAVYTAHYDADKGEFGTKNATNIDDGETGDNYISDLYVYRLRHPNADIQETTTTDATYASYDFNGKSRMPDLDGGFGIDFEAYGVTLSVSCSYRIGGYGMDYAYQALMGNDQVGGNNWHKDMLNSWTEWNATSNIPRLSNDNDTWTNYTSDRWLTSNSYLSLNNINLGYKFPKKLIEKAKMNSLQVWVAADNIAITTARRGYNPMMSMSGSSESNQYGLLSTVMAGVKVQF